MHTEEMIQDAADEANARDTLLHYAGIRPQREVIAALAMIHDSTGGYRSVQEYLNSLRRPNANPTLRDKWEWAYQFADTCLLYSKEFSPK